MNSKINFETKQKIYEEFMSYNLKFKKPTDIFMYSPTIDKVCLISNSYLKNKILAINNFEVLDTYQRFVEEAQTTVCLAELIDEEIEKPETIKEKFIEKYYCGFEEFNKKHPNSAYHEFTNQLLMKTTYEKDKTKMSYIALYLNCPFVEQLVKAGFEKLIFTFIEDEDVCCFNKFTESFKNAKNIDNITGLSSGIWKTLINNIMDIREYYECVDFIKKININKQQLEKIFNFNIPFYQLNSYCELGDENFNVLSINELLNYISKTITKQGLRPNRTMNLMTDYIRMCKELNIEANLKSEHLIKDHDRITDIYDKMTMEEKEKATKEKFIKRNKYLQKYLYEDERLKIVIPTTALDLYNEGKNNNNCVASYCDRHADGKTNILFIRKKDNPFNSYITLELNENKKEIIQAKYKHNKNIDNPKDNEFINNWMNSCVHNA